MTSDEIKSVLIDAQNAGIMRDTHLTSISIEDKFSLWVTSYCYEKAPKIP